MAEEFDPEKMLARFKERAAAVKARGLPPIEGADRKRFMEQAQMDYMDYSIIADGTAELHEGVLTITIDLRPASGN